MELINSIFGLSEIVYEFIKKWADTFLSIECTLLLEK